MSPDSLLAALPAGWLDHAASFLGGGLVGFWIGARFDLRRKRDL